MPPEICPNCDAEVPDDATSCPACGSDEATGWSQAAHCDQLGIPDPDEDFDYNAFVENEFGRTKEHFERPKFLWVLVAIVIIALFFGLLF